MGNSMGSLATISTHSLTKRLTFLLPLFDLVSCISTHSLTKRLTYIMPNYCVWPSISTHSLTKRLTRYDQIKVGEKNISTHSLTKRLTLRHLFNHKIIVYFNSQPHEEADRIEQAHRLQVVEDFNSQPHEEADEQSMAVIKAVSSFQLTASRRG